MTGTPHARTDGRSRSERLALLALVALLTVAGAGALAAPSAATAGASTADALPASATIQADDPLVVDDYDDPQAWNSDDNDLGYWTGAGNWETAAVQDDTLELSYTNGGWFVTNVREDVSAHEQLVIVARGDTGTEAEDLTLKVGQSSGSIADLSGQSIDGEFSTITVDLDQLTVDESSPGEIRIEAPYDGSSGTLEVDEIRFDSGADQVEGPEIEITNVPADPVETGEQFRLESQATEGDAPIESYEWDFGDGTTDDGWYTHYYFLASGDHEVAVTATDENGETATDTAVVEVREPPSVDAMDVPDELTVGETHRFDVDASAGDAPIASYEWDLGDGTTAFTESPQHAYQDAGEYTLEVTATDQNGLTDSETATLSVVEDEDAPRVAISMAPEDVVRTGERFGLAMDLEGDATPYRYEWDLDDGTVAETQSLTYSYDEAGEYTVTATAETQSGDVVTNSTEIVVEDGPTVEVTEAPESIPATATAQFAAEATAGGAPVESFEWDFDDGETATSAFPTHAFGAPGQYDVQVTVTDENGFSYRDTVTVDVTDAPVAHFNTTFTGDPVADSHEIEVTLTNPEILDRDDVDRVTVSTQNVRFQVESTPGFTQSEDSRHVWIADADDPAPTMTLETVGYDERSWTQGVDDTDLIRLGRYEPKITIESDDPDALVDHHFDVANEGYVSEAENRLFYGAIEDSEQIETEHGPLRLTVPAAADYGKDLKVLAQAMAEFSDDLETGGDHYAGIAGFALPDEAYTGRSGRATVNLFFTDDGKSLTTAHSTWIHEFAHVTDTVGLVNDSLRWHTEAYATYYTTLKPLEIEHGAYDTEVFEGTHYEQYRNRLENGQSWAEDLTNGTRVRQDDDFEYHYGALVLGAIDREIRAATDDATLEDVFVELHEFDGEPGHDDFLNIVANVSNQDVADQADLWIRADEVPETWSIQEHEAAFGYDVPQPEVTDVTVTGVVDGQRRELGDDRTRVSTEAPIEVDVTVQNHGSAPADVVFDVELEEFREREDAGATTFTVPGGQTETATFEYHADETRWFDLEGELDTVGPYSLGSHGGEELDQGFIALHPDAALVEGTGDTTLSNPATVQSDQQLALHLGEWYNSAAEVELESLDSNDEHAVQVDDSLHLAVTHASELETGETYRVEFPHDSDDTQYLEVVQG